MAGAFDWLDTLASQVGVVAGKAVDVAGNVAVAKATAGATADATPVGGTSPIQNALSGANPYLIGGLVLAVVVGAFVLSRRK